MKYFNDEILLAFLLGELDKHTKDALLHSLETDKQLRQRLHSITLINNNLAQLPPSTFIHQNRGPFLRTALALTSIFIIAFCLGLFIERQFRLLSSSEYSASSIKNELTQPITWDEKQLASIM